MVGKSLKAAVGLGKENRVADVLTVQYLLNCVPVSEGGPVEELLMDGIAGPQTRRAIEHFQQVHFGQGNGCVEPGRARVATFRKLREYDPFPDSPPLSPPMPDVSEEERRGLDPLPSSGTSEGSIPGMPAGLDASRWQAEAREDERKGAARRRGRGTSENGAHRVPPRKPRRPTAFVREVVLPGGIEAVPRLKRKYCYFPLKLAPSPIHRWGVFATAAIPARRRVIEYSGEKIDAHEVWRRSFRHHLYLFWLNDRWALDGAVGGSGAEFINHSCDPNLEAHSVRGHIYFTSLRPIAAQDELTLDYHLEDEGLTIPCTCGSPRCKGIVSG
ncbi:MAG: SET domain-containing protein-lysine N-methyltransferase [Pirellulaceae bacterium]